MATKVVTAAPLAINSVLHFAVCYCTGITRFEESPPSSATVYFVLALVPFIPCAAEEGRLEADSKSWYIFSAL